MKIRYLILIPVCLQLLNLFYFHFNHHFYPKQFNHGFHQSYARDVSGLDYEPLDGIFSQPFSFLGSGKQMIAFESADHKYVLKLFNPMRPLKKNWYKQLKYWQRYSSFKWISREWFQKKQRLKKLFDRYQIAYEKLRDESGLVFVHLGKSPRVNQTITVRDATGKTHILHLETTPFILQEKATLVPEYLDQLISLGQMDKAKQALIRIEELFHKRLTEGITDRIQTMYNNYGFVGDKPIQIDMGRIRVFPELKEEHSNEKKRILENFYSWVDNHYPQLL